MTAATDKKASIALIGECMIEIQQHANGTMVQGFAGDTLNTAVYLARLIREHGHRVQYVTALGDSDSFSQAMLQQWQAEGIGCDYVRRLPGKLPGLYNIDVDANGERSFTYWRGESAARQLLEGDAFDPQLESLLSFDYLYLSGISLAILPDASRHKLLAWLVRARAHGARVCFDNNYRPRLWRDAAQARHWYEQVLRITDIALLTYEDECMLWGDSNVEQVFARCRDLAIGEVVLKRGHEPCLVETSAGRQSIAAIAVAPHLVVDTTAAGDSFSAGYLAARLQGGCTPADCATLGHRIASTVIQYRGGLIPRDAMPEIGTGD